MQTIPPKPEPSDRFLPLRTRLSESAVWGRFLPALLALSLLLNAGLGFLFFTARSEPDGALVLQDASTFERFPYLSKRIFAEKQNDILINFIPLRSVLREYVAKLPEKVGVYFEYLPSGNSIGVNDTMEVEIASLAKIPLVMDIYRDLELGILKKDTLLTVRPQDIDQGFGTFWQKGAGTTLTVEEAIRITLQESDNTTANVLQAASTASFADTVFNSLDIRISREGESTKISPKSYSSIFRSLYLASYLSRDSSNEILRLLTHSAFNEQIRAGVPEYVPVSHKIGVFQSAQVYSDCGIVYVPNRPYLLCVIVESKDIRNANQYISHISKMIYGYVSAVQSSANKNNSATEK